MKRKKGYVFDGRWEVIKPLGEGGQGNAYLVRDVTEEIDGQLVLKELHSGGDHEPPRWQKKRLARFKQEISALDRVKSSKRVAPILHSEVDKSTSFYVTPFVGKDMSRLPRPQQPEPLLRRFRDIVEAVHDAHTKDVAHRDIKPNNVTVDESGRAFLVDFGISVHDDAESGLTDTMEALGNRSFAAPECEPGSDEECGLASDVYSLGKVLYWMASDGKKMAQQNFDEEKLTVAGAFARHYIAVAIAHTVREEPGSRWSVTELLNHVDWILAKLAEHAALNATVLVDGFGPDNSMYKNSFHAVTKNRGNPPADHEAAESFKVTESVVLQRVDVGVALFEGSGRLWVALIEGDDDAPSEDADRVVDEWMVDVNAGPSKPEVVELLATTVNTLGSEHVYWIRLVALDQDSMIGWIGAALELCPRRTAIAQRAAGGEWETRVSVRGPGQACRVLGRVAKKASTAKARSEVGFAENDGEGAVPVPRRVGRNGQDC